MHYVCEIVAKEINRGSLLRLYAVIPFLECLRMVVSSALNGSVCRSDAKSKMKVMACDVSRAYSYAPAIRPAYVKLIEGAELEDGQVWTFERVDARLQGCGSQLTPASSRPFSTDRA